MNSNLKFSQKTTSFLAGKMIVGAWAAIFVLLLGCSPKVESDPEYRWHTFYGGGDGASSSGYSIAVDGNGDIFVAGYSSDSWDGPQGQSPLNPHSNAGGDIVVLKLNKSGAYQWHTFFGGGDFDICFALALDEAGNIYLTGYAEKNWAGPNGESPVNQTLGTDHTDVVVLKLNQSGAYQWHAFYGGDWDDSGSSIAVDRMSNIYITGYSYGYSDDFWKGPNGQEPLNSHSGVDDIFIIKLDTNGKFQWHAFYGANKDDYGLSLAVDENGDIIVTGGSESQWDVPNSQSVDIAGPYTFVLKLDSNGTRKWNRFLGGRGAELALDHDGNIFVTGNSEDFWDGPEGQRALGDSPSSDVFVSKLDSGGAYQWHTFYGPGDDYYWAGSSAIAVDDEANVYVAGTSTLGWESHLGEAPASAFSGEANFDYIYEDAFILKLNAIGIYQWHTFLGGVGLDEGKSLIVDENGSIFNTGWSDTYGSWEVANGDEPLNFPLQGRYEIFVSKLSDEVQQ